jgi:hypothetical protein
MFWASPPASTASAPHQGDTLIDALYRDLSRTQWGLVPILRMQSPIQSGLDRGRMMTYADLPPLTITYSAMLLGRCSSWAFGRSAG